MRSWLIGTPVGLLGVQSRITFVRAVTAAAMASRSWPSKVSSGTRTGRAPASSTRMGYASKERHAKITSSPASHRPVMICWRTPTLPGPTATSPAVTPKWLAIRSRSSTAALSG